MEVNYSDTQLKQALAKMLPETLLWDDETSKHNTGRPQNEAWGLCWDSGNPVLDTEFPYLCWLAEEKLCEHTGKHEDDYSQRDNYSKELMKLNGTWNGSAWDWGNVCNADLFQSAHATWQQRVIALAKVKGIEI